MNRYDQAARYGAKQLDAPGFLRWLVPAAFAGWAFRGWLDTRTVTFPGAGDRTCDTVAEFERTDGSGDGAALVIEFQSEPEADMLEREAEYILRLRRELPGGQRGERLLVFGALLNLTGPPRHPGWEMASPGFEDAFLRFQVILRTVREESAAATLAGIAAGQISRALLAWVSLMQGVAEPAIIEEWKRLALAEADRRLRGD